MDRDPLGTGSASRSRRVVGLLLALAAQGLLWLPLLRVEPQRLAVAGPALLEMRVLAPQPQLSRPVASPARHHPAARDAPPSPTLAPAAAALLEPSAPADATLSTATATTTTPARLQLALPAAPAASGPQPPGSMLSQILNDPRANSAKRSIEFAVADAAGTLPTVIQSSTDGTQSRLIRQGSKCLRVREARIKTLAPMHEATKATPAIAGSCVND